MERLRRQYNIVQCFAKSNANLITQRAWDREAAARYGNLAWGLAHGTIGRHGIKKALVAPHLPRRSKARRITFTTKNNQERAHTPLPTSKESGWKTI